MGKKRSSSKALVEAAGNQWQTHRAVGDNREPVADKELEDVAVGSIFSVKHPKRI
jgi:hypothetical protein